MNAQTVVGSAPATGGPTAAQVDVAVGTFKLLADPTRLRILWSLLHGEHAVGELADEVGAQPPAVSQHLAKLRSARLVRLRRQGNRVYYAADNAHVRHLVEEALFHRDHVVTGGVGHDAGGGPAGPTDGGVRPGEGR